MNVALLATLAWGAPDFDVEEHDDPDRGCELWLGKPVQGGVGPVRAECHWTDVTASCFRPLIDRLDQWHAFIPEIVQESIEATEPPRVLLWQYDDPGWPLEHREAMAWLTPTLGATARYEWKSAPMTAPKNPGAVLMPRDNGFWTVRDSPSGGLDVVQELDIDPGGAVPSWIVHKFQTSVLKADMLALHDKLTARCPAP